MNRLNYKIASLLLAAQVAWTAMMCSVVVLWKIVLVFVMVVHWKIVLVNVMEQQ